MGNSGADKLGSPPMHKIKMAENIGGSSFTKRERISKLKSGFSSMSSSRRNLHEPRSGIIQQNSVERTSKVITRQNSFVSSILSSGTLCGAQIRIPYASHSFARLRPDQPILSNNASLQEEEEKFEKIYTTNLLQSKSINSNSEPSESLTESKQQYDTVLAQSITDNSMQPSFKKTRSQAKSKKQPHQVSKGRGLQLGNSKHIHTI